MSEELLPCWQPTCTLHAQWNVADRDAGLTSPVASCDNHLAQLLGRIRRSKRAAGRSTAALALDSLWWGVEAPLRRS